LDEAQECIDEIKKVDPKFMPSEVHEAQGDIYFRKEDKNWQTALDEY